MDYYTRMEYNRVINDLNSMYTKKDDLEYSLQEAKHMFEFEMSIKNYKSADCYKTKRDEIYAQIDELDRKIACLLGRKKEIEENDDF